MSTPTSKRLLIVGWDAADWKIITPLLDAGLLPTLEKLINRGVMGNLATQRPILSPILWTSIATSKRADKHGVLGFVEPLPDGLGIRKVASTSRKCKALWNIATQAGLRSNVVGWYASHPAEPIRGAYVSEHFMQVGPRTGHADRPPEQSVHPASLLESLAELRVLPADITAQHILPLVPRLAEIPIEKQAPLAGVPNMLARCATVHATFTELLATQPWDLAAVYYETIDHFCHGFMKYHPPRMAEVPIDEFDYYKDMVAGIYRFHDMMLERLLDLAGDDTTVMVVSDHGFYSDHLRPTERPGTPVGPDTWHRQHGVFVMAGPNIAQDERIHGASILDIAPTALAILGLPIGRDMDGKVLAQCFTNPVEVERIDSWETVAGDAGLHPPDTRVDPLEQKEAIDQLIELGYLSAPTTDQARLVEVATTELQYNLAVVHLSNVEHAKAATILEKLMPLHRGEPRIVLSLAQCYLNLGRFAEAEQLMNAVETTGIGSAQHDILRGTLALAQDRVNDALLFLARAETAEPRLPNLHCQIGVAYARQQRWEEAERAFRKAESIDPDSPVAQYGLGEAALHQHRLEDAVDRLLRSVGLMHFFPQAHFLLGVALLRLKWYPRAIAALDTAVRLEPHHLQAHRFLAALHARDGNVEKAIAHRAHFTELLPRKDKM